MRPLNSPLEVGLRALVVLVASFPRRLDLNSLVLLDHALLHSGDFDGPASLAVAGSIRAGELGIKRELLEAGLEVMIRGGLAHLGIGPGGIEYWAAESSEAFVGLLETPYAVALRDRADWAVTRFGDLDETTLRAALASVITPWRAEFSTPPESEVG